MKTDPNQQDVGDGAFSHEIKNQDEKHTFEDGDVSTEAHGTDDPWQEKLEDL